MSHFEALERLLASSVGGVRPMPWWWPWAVAGLGIVVIIVGGVLFTP